MVAVNLYMSALPHRHVQASTLPVDTRAEKGSDLILIDEGSIGIRSWR